jgi:hypothetical protein
VGAVMRAPLRRELRHAGVLDAELFAKQGAVFMDPVVLCCESYPCIDAVGGPGTCVYDGIVGQCDRMENRLLNAVLPALGNRDPLWLRVSKRRDLRKRVLESSRLKDTISAIGPESYGTHAEPKYSVYQGTQTTHSLRSE